MSCQIAGCTADTKGRSLCNKHYKRVAKHGDPHGGGRRGPNGEGTIKKDCGYKFITVDGRQRREHIVVAERAIGKPLPLGALVHHVDEDRLNNDPSNLVICPDDAYHRLLHQRASALDACGHADWRKCPFCKHYSAPETMLHSSNFFYHAACRSAYRLARKAILQQPGVTP